MGCSRALKVSRVRANPGMASTCSASLAEHQVPSGCCWRQGCGRRADGGQGRITVRQTWRGSEGRIQGLGGWRQAWGWGDQAGAGAGAPWASCMSTGTNFQVCRGRLGTAASEWQLGRTQRRGAGQRPLVQETSLPTPAPTCRTTAERGPASTPVRRGPGRKGLHTASQGKERKRGQDTTSREGCRENPVHSDQPLQEKKRKM